jgi:uncharacterized heparinase superfamily protein
LRYVTGLRAASPDRLLIAPQDIRTADPTVANDIYAGYFSFAGRMENTHGCVPFEIPPPSPAWAAGLAGFGWLRHLRAADTPLSGANARALVDDWMTVAERGGDPVNWDPRVTTRRLLSWLSQSPLILEGADRAFYRRFMKSLGRHGAALQAALRQGLAGEDRLVALIALAELGLCADGLAKLSKRATRLLAQELSRQILPDGGHVGRNPQTIIDLLLDLLPLRQTYAARGQAAPQQLLNAIDRMLPMLRLFRMSDGSLALFNGMGVTAAHQLATVLAHDEARAAAMLNAPYSGYQRIEGADACVVMDTGIPPPAEYSGRAHASCLAFEMTTQGQRLVVNCGSAVDANPDLREATRSTAAHSTLVVADTSSCQFASGPGMREWIAGWIVGGPAKVSVTREADATGTALAAAHDGYARRFGVKHQRSISLSRDGASLRGEDRLTAAAGGEPPETPYAIRFHLHPMSHVAHTSDGKAVVITLANGARWLFQSSVAPVEIEESIFFASANRAKGAEQLVIHANAAEASAVAWSFERLHADEHNE